ncbi:carboxymuconolactone decarboxylase family protein [Myxococcota bacterium]|nr:carboxymuconolactone decarboxylase family protein [Myxococcota bacterium]
MPRLPLLALESAPESVKQLLAADRPNEIALLFGHAETNWPRLADLLLSILSQQRLDKRLRELAILRVANLRRAAYEWDQHVGISQEQIRAIEAGRIDAPCFAPLERLVLEATTELAETSTLSQATFDRLAAALSPRETVELLLAAGVYEALAKLMNALQLESKGPIDPDFAAAVNRGTVERVLTKN